VHACVQNRDGDCRDPKFTHYTARPYVMGLQDTIFGCGDAIHDFYHVEPQHTCLLDDSGQLVVDWVIRCECPGLSCTLLPPCSHGRWH
jgi:hypothetical protein